VRKLPAAPHVHTSGSAAASPPKADEALRRQALRTLRHFILANTENVGREFAQVARRIHHQEEDARNIRGQVTSEEAQELREEGVETFTVSPEVIPSEEVH
jgi:hypothetical protein